MEGLGFVFYWLCLHCWRMPFHLVLWVTSPGAPTADLAVSPPTSSAGAPSVPSRNNGSSSSSSSSSSSCVGCLDGVPYPLVRMCLAQVTLLPTALTRLTADSCLEKRGGSVGTMSRSLSGCALAIKVCERHVQAVPFQELTKWHACFCSDQEGEEE